VAEAGFFKRKLYDAVIGIMKKVDRRSAHNTDWFITNAKEVVKRIQKAYQPKNEITVINPPVKCANFFVSQQIDDYYLVVSRFEPYKRVDLVIDAFNIIKNKNLVIVGRGSMAAELKKKAGKNVKFLQGLDAEELANVFSRCRALIFPQLEDYGITPLEANASGRPVIAFGKGGVLDTMIPVAEDPKKATAVFFNEQTTQALIQAIHRFETLEFDPGFIRNHAEKYDEDIFVNKIRDFVFQKFDAKNEKLLSNKN
jgi:glycosyltransferase involved in cell wall biosynthesis